MRTADERRAFRAPHDAMMSDVNISLPVGRSPQQIIRTARGAWIAFDGQCAAMADHSMPIRSSRCINNF
jgi:hypothetical protein